MKLSQPRYKCVAARLAASMIVLAAVAPAQADAMSFFGTLIASGPTASGGRCSPAVTIVNKNEGAFISTGTSNLGSFLADSTLCVVPPLPAALSDGLFTFDFGSGNTLSGTIAGQETFSSTPGVLNIATDYVVTGGSGGYLGASGGFSYLALLDRREPTVANAAGVFRGELTLPVPESLRVFLRAPGTGS